MIERYNACSWRKCESKKTRWLFAFLTFLTAVQTVAAGPNFSQRYSHASSNYLAHPGGEAGWRFARACFDWAEVATNNTQRASLAKEGIEAARIAAREEPTAGPGNLYLALNQGQLASTKHIGALSLVREMERAFLSSIKADETFDHAAAHRSLGMLYRDAPSWPASIGNRSKARKHLERAVELASDYPDNHLSALEGYIQWEDKKRLGDAVAQYRTILPKAKEKYTGPDWEQPWRDWDDRWKAILKRAAKLGISIE